jgi:hypothetical protein
VLYRATAFLLLWGRELMLIPPPAHSAVASLLARVWSRAVPFALRFLEGFHGELVNAPGVMALLFAIARFIQTMTLKSTAELWQ